MDTLDTKLIEQSLEVMSLESRFHNPGWLRFTKTCLRECAPLDFFLQPASMSGQWHQGYELGVGGLIRHTVAAMEVARTLFPIYNFTEKEENSPEHQMWKKACEFSETMYMDLLNGGATPQQARSVLPNSLKTEVVVTMNIRNWRHFFEMRYLGVAGTPHPQMVEVAEKVFDLLCSQYPAFFEDLKKAD